MPCEEGYQEVFGWSVTRVLARIGKAESCIFLVSVLTGYAIICTGLIMMLCSQSMYSCHPMIDRSVCDRSLFCEEDSLCNQLASALLACSSCLMSAEVSSCTFAESVLVGNM